MRFIHLADMHLDNAFKVLAMKKDLGDLRRLEQRSAFKDAIEYIKQNKIPYFFIAGDLYEHKYIKQSTIEYVNNLFKTIPDTKIFITPGNHDPFLKNSFYNTFKWNDNVYIFDSEIKKYEFEDVDIYGYGFTDFYCTNSGIENIQIENKEKLNILIVHGALNSSKAIDASYNPISEGELKKLGFDYIALGHIHKANYQENTNIVYPGSAISCGFDELGEHGMLDVKLEKAKLNIDFIKLDKRIFEEKELDITTINSEEELVETINSLDLISSNMYKIILKGSKNFPVNLNNIQKLINQENILKIKDFSEVPYDIEAISKQNNLKGIFVKKCLEKLENNEYTEEQIKKVIEIGLGVL